MDTAEVRPESIWTQLKQDAAASEDGRQPNPVRQLARLIDETAVVRPSDPSGRVTPGFTDGGFFQVSAVEAETGRELVTPRELAEAVGLALEFSHGEFIDLSWEAFQAGPSYIQLGAWIGDQGRAIKLIALGGNLGLWDVITPSALGLGGDEASKLLGMGMLFPSPKSGSRLQLWFEDRAGAGATK